MTLFTFRRKVQEWLADRVSWVDYPPMRVIPLQPGPSLWYRYQAMTRKERGWVWFWCFWGAVVALSIYGNLLD